MSRQHSGESIAVPSGGISTGWRSADRTVGARTRTQDATVVELRPAARSERPVGRTVKVKVVLTVEVDADAWSAEYGSGEETLREDVRHYVGGLVAASTATQRGAVTHVAGPARVRPLGDY